MENREDPSAGETQSGGINVVKMICEQVVPLLRYLDGKLGKYGGPFDVESYVELVRKRTRVKVVAVTITAGTSSELGCRSDSGEGFLGGEGE